MFAELQLSALSDGLCLVLELSPLVELVSKHVLYEIYARVVLVTFEALVAEVDRVIWAVEQRLAIVVVVALEVQRFALLEVPCRARRLSVSLDPLAAERPFSAASFHSE